MSIIASRIESDFTEEQISQSAGAIFLSGMAEKIGLRDELSAAIKVKKRARGSSDAEMLLSLIYSLAQGDGALLDVDRLRHDQTRCEPLTHLIHKFLRYRYFCCFCVV